MEASGRCCFDLPSLLQHARSDIDTRANVFCTNARWSSRAGFFDPLGFWDEGKSPEERARLRAAELKHGRLAMLAAVRACFDPFFPRFSFLFNQSEFQKRHAPSRHRSAFSGRSCFCAPQRSRPSPPRCRPPP